MIRVNTTAEKRRFRWINAGKIRNTGIEVTVGATPLMNDNFRWKTQFNFATNKNEIVSLGGTPNFQYASGNVSMPYKMMVVEGGSLGDIYGNVLYVMKVAKFFWNRQRTKMATRTKKPACRR